MKIRTGAVWLAVALSWLAPAIVGSAHAQYTDSTTGAYQTDDLGDGLYGFRYGAYRNIFLISDEGVIASDPMSPAAAKILRQEIAKITDKPVRYVVYTQSNWDRIRGGQIFKDEGAKFVAQEQCLADLKNTPHPEVIMPDITYSDNYKIKLGNVSLELYYFGPSHGDCLSVLLPEPANKMMIANIVNPPHGSVPWNPTVPNLRLHNLMNFFDQVEALAKQKGVTELIGAYIAIGKKADGETGLLPAVGPFSAETEQRQFWQEFMAAVDAGMKQMTATELAAKMDMEPFKKYDGYNEDDLRILVRRVASVGVIGR